MSMSTTPVPTPLTMPTRPSLPRPVAVAPARPAHPVGEAPARRANPGDRLTVDPDDRRRRARTALLELAVSRSVERGRVI
jgi:hypothetical protein